MTTACPVCRSNEFEIFVRNPRDYEYFTTREADASLLVCGHCGSVYQSPWPTAEEVLKFYPSDYQNYARKDVPMLPFLCRHVVRLTVSAFLAAHGSGKRILDFGCGDGSFVKALAANGARNVVGFEPNGRDNSFVTGNGFELVRSIEDLEKRGPFGVIRMNHVIEHLSDLDKTMSALSALLEPGGVLLVQTPNPRSLTLKLFNKYWGALHYPYHTVLLSQNGLRDAAFRWNLRVTSIAPSMMPTGWSMSLENLIKSIGRSTRRGRMAIYGGLILITAPLTLAEKLFFRESCSVYDCVLVKT
jgi:YgiT-type zinc finger domain-containing protein